MKKTNVLIMDKPSEAITGGEIYNRHFYTVLRNNFSCDIKYAARSEYAQGLHWSKFAVPFLELKYLSRTKDCDIVFWNSSLIFRHIILLLTVRLFTRKRCMIIHHHYEFPMRKSWRRLLWRVMELSFLHLSTDLILPSPYTLALSQKFFPAKQLHYVPIPFETTWQANEPCPGELLYVGTIEERKGLKYLIATLAKLRDLKWRLTIAGHTVDDKYRDELASLIAANGQTDQVFFTGRLSARELENYYRRAEIFVFPSLLEGYGMVLIEAMRMGVPTVAFDNSAMPYSIKSGINGILVPDRDIDAFATALRELLGNDELRTRMQSGMRHHLSSLPTEKDFVAAIARLMANVQECETTKSTI